MRLRAYRIECDECEVKSVDSYHHTDAEEVARRTGWKLRTGPERNKDYCRACVRHKANEDDGLVVATGDALARLHDLQGGPSE